MNNRDLIRPNEARKTRNNISSEQFIPFIYVGFVIQLKDTVTHTSHVI